MRKSSKIPVAVGVIVAALLGGLLAGHFQNRGEKSLTPTMESADTAPSVDLPPADEIHTDLSEIAAPAAVPESEGDIRVREAFVKWRQSEAAKLDSTQVNEDLEIASLDERIKKLTPVEWREAARQILDTQAPANERVFSAYLLGQGGLDSTFTEELTTGVLMRPLPNPGPHPVHSLEETEAMREKSLRMLVVEELIQQVKKDSRKREGLERSVRAIEDAGLRNLAFRRMREEGL